MKYIFKISLLLLAACSLVNAQDSAKKVQLGFDIAYAKPTLFKDGFFPSLTFSLDKQVIFAGAGVIYYDAWHPRPITGIQAGYRVFPNGRDKRFNLFFECNTSFFKGSIEDRMSFYQFEIWGGTGTRTIDFTAIDNYFGFGFRWNVLKNLYISSNMGVDLGFYKENYTYEYANGQRFQGEGNMVLRDPLAFYKIFKISVGYDLYRLR